MRKNETFDLDTKLQRRILKRRLIEITIIFFICCIALIFLPNLLENTDQTTENTLNIGKFEFNPYDLIYNIVNPEAEDIEPLIYQYINEERTSRGISNLEWDEDLVTLAKAHSEDMVENDYFLPPDIPAGYGATINSMPTGNVVGMGYVTKTPEGIAEATVRSWIESSSCDLILDPSFTHTSIGVDYDGINYLTTEIFY